MSLIRLGIQHFRNIETTELEPSQGLNLITGANAAGKTSLLEAICFLGRARSFRTNRVDRLVQHGATGFRILGRLSEGSGRSIPVGMERRQGRLEIRLDGKSVQRLSELAAQIPLQLHTGDAHSLLEGGPRYRRRFLDWGLFHVEPAFYQAWSAYRKILKQRNAALRRQTDRREIAIWDRQFTDSAMAVNQLRIEFLDRLRSEVLTETTELLGTDQIELHYRSGWPSGTSLLETLMQSREQDLNRGFSHYGPHRADLEIRIENRSVHGVLSRGQQKLLTTALFLGQAALLHKKTESAGMFLIDDLPSELDSTHQQRMMARLAALNAQVFVSAIEKGTVPTSAWSTMKWFHVEHGNIQEML